MLETTTACKQLLVDANIDIFSSIDFDVNGHTHSLSFEYIIDTFMQASQESQLVFYAALEKSIKANNEGVEKFFEGMGQLLLMTHLSDKIEI